MERLARWLGARWAPWIAILVGLALAAPAVTSDFAADDHIQRVVARDDPGIPGLRSRPFDQFVFADGDPAHTATLRDVGFYPWWVDPSIRLAFFRPLSSATHALDRALWPDAPGPQLAQNLLWLALALAAAWAFFRRFVSVPWIAVLALALYAVDDARGPVVGWIANRNALVALALALPALGAHDRWRREGWSPGRWLGPGLFALALGAGESALSVTAYLAAHALWLDRGTWRSRILALAPYALIVLAWRALYGHLGYGVAGSGIYFDPGGAPVAFLGAAATRIPFLLASQLALPWSDLASLYPIAGVVAPMLAIALATLAMIGAACARIIRRDPATRFFATGMLLSAIPIASTFPADRLLSFVGLGGMGLMAQLLAAAARDRGLLGDGRARRIFGVAVAILMVVIHVVLAPPLLALRARSMVAVGRVLDRADAGVPSDPSVTAKTVMIAAAPNDALGAYVPIMRTSRDQPRPAHLYWLAVSTAPVTLERIDPLTLRVTPEGGFLRYEVDRMMRAAPFHIGDRIPLTGLTIEVTSITSDGRPASVLAHFTTPPEDPTFVWLRWEGTTYVPYHPPAVGARDTLPATDFAALLK